MDNQLNEILIKIEKEIAALKEENKVLRQKR